MLLLSKRKRSTVDADCTNLPQGSLDLLVPTTLAPEPLHARGPQTIRHRVRGLEASDNRRQSGPGYDGLMELV